MTRDAARQLLHVIKAYCEGKVIQYRFHNGEWEDFNDPSFDREPDLYRVKPEPREWWFVEGERAHPTRWDSFAQAEGYRKALLLTHSRHQYTIFHVREVL